MKIKKHLKIIGVVLLCVVTFFAGFFTRAISNKEMTSLRFVLNQYEKYYLEESDDYISIMANSLLDKYSKYYTAEEYELIQKASKGMRAGIGLTVSNVGGNLFISSVVGNSPAENAGVTAGGIVVGTKVNDETEFTVSDYNGHLNVLNQLIEGDILTIKVDYEGEEKTFTFQKREYTETYVYYADQTGCYRFNDNGTDELKLVKYEDAFVEELPSQTAYIKFTAFNGLRNDLYGAVKQIETVLDKFKKNQNVKLIFDLRNNGGGYMDIMSEIASHFIGETDGARVLVSKAVYKDGKEDKFKSKKVVSSQYNFKQLVFLCNENTASASEAFVGACLDYDYDDIVKVVLSRSGREGNYVYRSYGKGIMQTTIENLLVGDAIKLTTAKIYWPKSNVCIHDVGITKELEEYSKKIIEASFLSDCDYELKEAINICSK